MEEHVYRSKSFFKHTEVDLAADIIEVSSDKELSIIPNPNTLAIERKVLYITSKTSSAPRSIVLAKDNNVFGPLISANAPAAVTSQATPSSASPWNLYKLRGVRRFLTESLTILSRRGGLL